MDENESNNGADYEAARLGGTRPCPRETHSKISPLLRQSRCRPGSARARP